MFPEENQIKKEISVLIKKFCRLRKSREKFVPGKTRIKYSDRIYDEKEITNLMEAALDFWLTAGPFAEKFEKKLADFLKVKFCILTNSGSSANLLAISSLTSEKLGNRRLRPGDEVITVACGFPTTLNPIIQNNLKPVFIDVDLGTYNIQAEKIERALSEKTKAIFIAHTLGNPANLDRVSRIAKKHKLWLIEDCCDALGSKYKGKYVGTFGDISTFSFYPAHQMTTGEGGAVTTNNPELRKIIASFRDWGRDCWCEPGEDNCCKKRFGWKFGNLPQGYDHKYVFSHIGYNLKMTDLQAAIGLAQLEKLPSFIRARRKNFASLYDFFRRYERYFALPVVEKYSQPCWFGFPLLVKSSAPFKRAKIINFLEENKIATRMLFGGNLTKQPAYRKVKYRIFGSLDNTDLVMNNLFWIGLHPGIKEAELKYIKERFGEFLKQY